MKAKKVFENIEFKRNQETTRALAVGRNVKVKNLLELYELLKDEEYPELEYEQPTTAFKTSPMIHVDNHNGQSITIRQEDDTFEAVTMGYKQDIDIGDIGNIYSDIVEEINSIDQKWIEENDPDADRW